MAKTGERVENFNTIQVYSGAEHVGEIIGGKYQAVAGKKKPTLKSDYEYEMLDELVGLGYKVIETRRTIRESVAVSDSGCSMIDELGLGSKG